ncbi:MAG: PD-(D/E)XK nuclease family protein [Bacteroidales bacterium]|jgi:CRISPR/Cas system-associated exonuclease Cas4 (RecB family)|nr:PD-(D/E)XK nuclease family protein [Bacteroidales bacterium]
MMDFLERVAFRLHEDCGDAMEKQIIVLPSRRAGLYLSRYLARLSDKPQWSPLMMTVNELFGSFTELRPADTENQVFELYRIYKDHFTGEMSFDDFWSWGEVIISDFNDIDFYLADAAKLYSNIADLKEIDQKFGGLTEEQTEIIRSFWKSFNPGASESAARSKFQSVWQKLAPLYTAFRSAMLRNGHAGEGMICREVAEMAASGTLRVPEGMTWHIAGLNALNNCEKVLFKFLKSKDQARFYWDEEHFFMNDPDHKASFFIRENISLFGNTLERNKTGIHAQQDKRWTIIDTPADTAQARMLPAIFDEAGIDTSGDLTDTAVILADEKLLFPVLTSLPPSIGAVNVTMGHPFRFTSLYSFLKQLMSLIRSARITNGVTSFRSDEVITLLRHQYYRLLAGDEGEKMVNRIFSGNMIRIDAGLITSELSLGRIFTLPSSGSELPGHLVTIMEMIENATYSAQEENRSLSIDREYLRMAMAATGKLANLIQSYQLELKPETCIRFLDRVFRKLIVPFSGEPLKGLQVMGLLETRALEFKHIVFLSLNEGIFPGQAWDNTFIPYNIRRAFGLPTVNEHESIYSYHFFRLLRKPLQGWFLYNSTAQGLSSGEMSRYLVQMQYSPLFITQFRSLHITVGRSRMVPESIVRQKSHSRMLLDLYDADNDGGKYLSPSAINTWLTCRMRFYYRYVCDIPEEEKLEEDIDQRRFGNILHETLNRLYLPLKEIKDSMPRIREMADQPGLIRETIISAASSEMKRSAEALTAGRSVIIIDVLERYVNDLLRYDAAYEDLTILNLEDILSGVCTVNGSDGEIRVRIGGRADRVDITGGALRIVDYKTGTPKRDIVSVSDLFNEEKEKRNDALLQAMLYCHLMGESYPGRVVIPAIYWVQLISSSDFTPYIPVPGIDGPGADRASWTELMTRFRRDLVTAIGTIFSENEDFKMTRFVKRCNWCPYRMLCGR